MPLFKVFLTINGIDQANNATATPTIPQSTKFLAYFIFSGSPWEMGSSTCTITNMIMKKATAIGQRMLNIISMMSLMDNPGTVFGTGPGLNANTIIGINKGVKTNEESNFLFTVFRETTNSITYARMCLK